jgi:hypothetical protein
VPFSTQTQCKGEIEIKSIEKSCYTTTDQIKQIRVANSGEILPIWVDLEF